MPVPRLQADGGPILPRIPSDRDGDGFDRGPDCNDWDASVWPGAVETLGDPTDSNCDGYPGVGELNSGALVWEGARAPSLTATDDHFLLGAIADSLVLPGGMGFEEAALVLPFPVSVPEGMPPPGAPFAMIEMQADMDLGFAMDTVAPGGQSQAFGFDYQWVNPPIQHMGYAMMHELEWNPTTGLLVRVDEDYAGIAEEHRARDVDMATGTLGRRWLAVCGDGIVHVLVEEPGGPGHSLHTLPLVEEPPPTQLCFWTRTPDDAAGLGQVVSCGVQGSCVVYPVEPFTSAALFRDDVQAPWEDRNFIAGDLVGEWRVLVEAGSSGVVLEHPDGRVIEILQDLVVSGVDVDWRTAGGPEDELAVAVVAEALVPDGLGPRLYLAWGPPDALERVEVDMEQPIGQAWVPSEVSVAVTTDRVALAATGKDGVETTLQWAFWAW